MLLQRERCSVRDPQAQHQLSKVRSDARYRFPAANGTNVQRMRFRGA